MFSFLHEKKPPPTHGVLFTLDALEKAYLWICNLRKDYSHNADIWNVRRDWHTLKYTMLKQLNDGSYTFSLLDRYVFDDATITLWSSLDMIALKLITLKLSTLMGERLPKACYHLKGHGGLKKAVQNTHNAIPNYQYFMRSDVKSYYESIDHYILMEIIETYINHPVLLKLLRSALNRTETRGGLFYTYDKQSLPMGSPLSPLLGAIALLPLDQALTGHKDIFYARYMDDWIVLTKTKTALRKIIKKTHLIINSLRLSLHPSKTSIGKITNGFNFLGYYFDPSTILPSKESLRRFQERATALYEHAHPGRSLSRCYKRSSSDRDISAYFANEEAPTASTITSIIKVLWTTASKSAKTLKRLRLYVRRWCRWCCLGLSESIVIGISKLLQNLDLDLYTDAIIV